MNGNDCKSNISNLMKNYIILEKQIKRLVSNMTKSYCCSCSNTCCRENICRESIDSAFLKLLVEKQKLQYDLKNGWMSPDGCRLAYGRPLICYEFFCEKIARDDDFENSGLDKLIKTFVSVGQRAHRGQHLIAIHRIENLSNSKIDNINGDIVKLLHKANIFLQPPRFPMLEVGR